MKPAEAAEFVWKTEYTAQLNQLYYERLHSWWRGCHRTIRMTMLFTTFVGGILGLINLVASIPVPLSGAGVAIGIVSMAVALILSEFPLQGLVTRTVEMGRAWTSIRLQAEQLLLRIDGLDQRVKLPDDVIASIAALQAKKAEIDTEEREHPPWKGLLLRCQRELNRRNYRVREGTFDEVMESLRSA